MTVKEKFLKILPQKYHDRLVDIKKVEYLDEPFLKLKYSSNYTNGTFLGGYMRVRNFTEAFIFLKYCIWNVEIDNERQVKKMLNKAFGFKEFEMFINNGNKLIVVSNINAYFSLDDVKNELDFKCKIIECLSYYTSINHWNRYWSPKMIKFINYMLDTDFNKEEMQLIYRKLGNGINHQLTIKFIRNGYNLKVLKDLN